MKKIIISILLILSCPLFAEAVLLLKAPFRSLTPFTRVQGEAKILRTASGADVVSIENFKLRGGVVLDLKVCGEPRLGEWACISIGEPRESHQEWEIPYTFERYRKVLIFDLDLAQNLAEAL